MLIATLSAFASVGGVTLPDVDPPEAAARSSEATKLLHGVHGLHDVGADSMAFGWRSRRRLNAVDEPTFLMGDWRTTGVSLCAHECNRPGGSGTTGRCDERDTDDGVCEIGTDCRDCGVAKMDQQIATISARDCHLHISTTCSEGADAKDPSRTYWTGTGCAAQGIDTSKYDLFDTLSHEIIDPDQGVSCNTSGSTVFLTHKYAWRDSETPTNMKHIECGYYDRSSRDLQASSVSFLRPLSTPLSSITCPPDASAARALAAVSPGGSSFAATFASNTFRCVGDCGGLSCSNACKDDDGVLSAPIIGPIVGAIVLCCICTWLTSRCCTCSDEDEDERNASRSRAETDPKAITVEMGSQRM